MCAAAAAAGFVSKQNLTVYYYFSLFCGEPAIRTVDADETRGSDDEEKYACPLALSFGL